MEGDDDSMLSNAADAAEKNQTRTITLDQEQEDDRKEEAAEVEADSDAGCTIDPLREEIQGLQDKKWVVELQLVISEVTNRFLANEVSYLENELARAQQGLAEEIPDDVGGAFGMGGGSAYRFIKGLYKSPSLVSAIDGSMVCLRQKEDPWNSVVAGAATGGFLQMLQGPGPAARSALFGCILLAFIEGAGDVLN